MGICIQDLKPAEIFITFIRKDNKEKYYIDLNSYRDVINYITGKSHPDKQVRYIGGYGIDCRNIDNTIKMFKSVFKHCRHSKRQKSRKLYHLMMSFSNPEFDPNVAQIIGSNIGKYLFSLGYQNIYAVHEDTENIHIHIVFNSANIFWHNLYHATKQERDFLREQLNKIAADTANGKCTI